MAAQQESLVCKHRHTSCSSSPLSSGPDSHYPHLTSSLHFSIHTVITAGLETCPWYGPSESRCLGHSKRCQVWRLIFKVFMATAPIKRTRCGVARSCSGGGRRVTAADGRISTQQLSGQRGAAPHRCTQTGLLLHLLGYVL